MHWKTLLYLVATLFSQTLVWNFTEIFLRAHGPSVGMDKLQLTVVTPEIKKKLNAPCSCFLWSCWLGIILTRCQNFSTICRNILTNQHPFIFNWRLQKIYESVFFLKVLLFTDHKHALQLTTVKPYSYVQWDKTVYIWPMSYMGCTRLWRQLFEELS